MSVKPTYNPYHFVPVKPGGHSVIDLKSYLKNAQHITHDRYVKGTYSGRIVCRLTAQSPIFVGGQRIREATEKQPALARHFFLPVPENIDNPGLLPAIPATSLRGLISSIAEAASNSSLRVLSDQFYSYRKSMAPDEALSAIGMITVKNDEKGTAYWLTPLTIPTLKAISNQSINHNEIDMYALRDLFPFPNLKVYIGNSDQIRKSTFHRTYRGDQPKFYGLKLVNRSWNTSGGIDFDTHQYRRNSWLLGQLPLQDSRLKPWDEISCNEKGEYTRGILRVLGCWDERKDAIPDTKKHELFIPYPEIKWNCLRIADDTIKRFYQLSDQRTHSNSTLLLPFEPKDTQRNVNANDNRFRLKTGDLVYFRNVGNEITEISLSSIWRGRVEMHKDDQMIEATTHDFFRAIAASSQKLNQELLPFHAERETITLAEQIFGFVQQDTKTTGSLERSPNDRNDNSFLALAGRLWFSHAQICEKSAQEPYLEEQTLKILDSPKPPCPSLYFKNRQEPKYIRKSELSPDKHYPQGRKFYLHHQRSINNNNSKDNQWRSDNENSYRQKVRVQPVKAGSIFYFHIDFENLSRIDLGMLLFALEPTPKFRHKIGMGKSIGLGTVKIERVGYYEIDRQNRYSAMGFIDNRYCRYEEKDKQDWPNVYQSLNGTIKMDELDTIRDEFVYSNDGHSKVDPDILKALSLIGDYDYKRVQTPGLNSTPQKSEEETFKWFVLNERGKEGDLPLIQQFLRPLDVNSVEIEPLKKHPYRR